MGEIKFTMIIEVIGKPPEYLIETLEDLISKIQKEKGVDLKEKRIKDPVTLKDNKDFFISFAELDIEVEKFEQLSFLMFKYMPAHVEVLEPMKLSLSNTDMNTVMNEILIKLHKYDDVARSLEMEKKILEKRIRELIDKNKS